MNKTKGALALLIGLALVAAPTVPAFADDLPPEDVTIEVPAAPAAEVPKVVPEVLPDPVVEEVPAPAPAARIAVSTATVKLAICHSGSGSHFSYIAPDASGYNGHQHHGNDSYGLTEEECLAQNPPVDLTPFVLIAWPMPGWIDDHTPTWPQGTAAGLAAPFTADLATRNLDALDSTLNALIVPCETSVQFQVDGNFDTEPVRNTIDGGYLNGPNDPAEALWGGGWGEAYKLVKIDGPTCPPPPTVEVCESHTSNHSTDLLPNGWSGDGEWVDGGYSLPVTGGWQSSYIERAVNLPIEQALADLDIDASPIQYVGLHFKTADGRWITYEEEPSYGGKLWSTSAFAGVLDGMGYAAFGTADEFVAENAGLQIIEMKLLYTHPEESSSTITSVSFGCGDYTFDKVDEPETPPAKVTVFEGEWSDAEVTCDVPETEADESVGIETRTVVTTRIPWLLVILNNEYSFIEDLERAEVISTVIEEREVTHDGECPTPTDPPTEEPPVKTPPVTPQGGLADTGFENIEWVIAGGLAVIGGIAFLIFAFRRRTN